MAIDDNRKRRLVVILSWITLTAAHGCGRDAFVALGKRARDSGTAADGGGDAMPRTASGAPSKPSAQNASDSPRDMPPPRVSIDETGPDNPAGLSAADVAKLKGGGPVGSLRWLYPYDGTVFPRDLIAPTLMWNGSPTANAIYVRITSKGFDSHRVGYGHLPTVR